MSIARDWSEYQVLGLVGHSDHKPQNDPRLCMRMGKNRRPINGVYDNSSLYITDYSDNTRAILRNECRNALNPGSRHLFERPLIEPHAVRVCDQIWISDLYTATDTNVLQALGISHIVAIYGSRETRPLYPKDYRTEDGQELLFHCILWDEGRELRPASSILANAQKWITEALWIDEAPGQNIKGNPMQRNVLIHYLTGCTRAAVVALATLAPLMEVNMLKPVCARLFAIRPTATLQAMMETELQRFWAAYGQKQGVSSSSTDSLTLSINDVFNETFPSRYTETARRRHEWWNDPRERPRDPPTSGPIKRDGSWNYSAVIKYPEMEPEAVNIQSGEEQGEVEDKNTEVGEPGDAGNALLAELKRDETLEAIDVGW